jgi:hypothetical protein
MWVVSSGLKGCIARRPTTTAAMLRRLSNAVRTAAVRGYAAARIAESVTIPLLA